MVSTHRHTCISHETPQECYWHNAKAALHIFFENRPKCHPYVFGHKASSICFNCDMDCITDGRHLSCRGCIVEAVVDLHLHAHTHTHTPTWSGKNSNRNGPRRIMPKFSGSSLLLTRVTLRRRRDKKKKGGVNIQWADENRLTDKNRPKTKPSIKCPNKTDKNKFQEKGTISTKETRFVYESWSKFTITSSLSVDSWCMFWESACIFSWILWYN